MELQYSFPKLTSNFQCMQKVIFSDVLKTARLLKVISQTTAISVLTHFSNIFEKLIGRRLANFFDKIKVINNILNMVLDKIIQHQ